MKKISPIFLDIILEAPLRAEVTLDPVVVDIHEGEMVARLGPEVLVGVVGVDLPVLGSVEDGATCRQHRNNGQNFLGALVLFRGD